MELKTYEFTENLWSTTTSTTCDIIFVDISGMLQVLTWEWSSYSVTIYPSNKQNDVVVSNLAHIWVVSGFSFHPETG